MRISPLIAAAGLVLALLVGGTSRPSLAASETTAAPAAESLPFTLIILGTRHYGDADVLRRNIARIPLMQRFVPTVSSQNHLQFSGIFGGGQDALVTDIQGLAAERFDVQTRQDKTQGLIITVRKIQDGQ